MVSHILVIGETQSGKTYYANKLHRGSDGTVSVFFNTNHVPNLWGDKVGSLNELVEVLKRGSTKVVYTPYRGSSKEDMLRTQAELKGIIDFLFRHWTHESTRWARLIIDEAQWFEEECRYAMTMGLGKHIQVVAITQYPVMVDTTSRSNIPTWVIFRTGFQMEKFFQGFGNMFPREAILAHTARQYHFVRHTAERGWEAYPPVA